MPGVHKQYSTDPYRRRRLLASRYDDPRGGQASGLERDVLRYRACEAALYLFYAEEIRNFLLTNLRPRGADESVVCVWDSAEERRLHALLSQVLRDARSKKELSAADADALDSRFSEKLQRGKRLRASFAEAIKLQIFTPEESDELHGLLDYRNDIAHRIHLIMADVSRSAWTADMLSVRPQAYKGDALDKLRRYRESLWDRASKQVILQVSLEPLTFEFAERFYEAELKRLDCQIQVRICREQKRLERLRPELDLRGTELVGDLDPRYPPNHRQERLIYGDDYTPMTGHLSKRGVEICYRLYDLGRSPHAVAYLMGITLRSAERRYGGWLKAGGHSRVRAEVKRYNITPYGRGKLNAEPHSTA